MADTNGRQNVLLPESYFMAVAALSAQRSPDPRTQVGACVVNQERKIVGVGYNRMPNNCNKLPWTRHADNVLDNKYLYVCHAELNAIVNKNCSDLNGCTIYTTLFPCNECAKLIIQTGIKEVVYLSDKYSGEEPFVAARRMLQMANITLRPFVCEEPEVVINLRNLDTEPAAAEEAE